MPVTIMQDTAVSPNYNENSKKFMCAYPQITVTRDNAIACLYRRGITKHSSDGHLMMQLSTDNGASWNEPLSVFDKTGDSPSQTICSAGICATSYGELLVSAATTLGLPPDTYIFSDEGNKLPRRINIMKSSSNGISWSEAEFIDFNPYARAGITTSPFELADGQIVIPIEVEAEKGNQASVIVFPEVDGFGPLNVSACDNSGRLNLCDARYTILNNGDLLALLWTFVQGSEETLNVHKSYSQDNGMTWSKPEITSIKGQVTVPLTHSSGKLIAATNYRNYPEGIYLWESDDNGNSWCENPLIIWDERKKVITGKVPEKKEAKNSNNGVWEALQGFTFGTPDLKEFIDGSILMSYYATLNEIVHVRCCNFKIT